MIVSTERLQILAEDYVPGAVVAKALRDVSLVPIIGPTAVGKSTRIENIIASHMEYGRSVGFTTRPKRTNENDRQYNFLSHNQPTLASIERDVSARKLVQFAVHPETGYVYGSGLSDYRQPYTLIDVFSTAVDELRQIPFKTITEVSLVCEPDIWEQRFKLRKDQAITDARKRVSEGISSLIWSLDQTDMIWVDNSYPIDGDHDPIVEIAQGTRDPDVTNRLIGEKMLANMRTIEF